MRPLCTYLQAPSSVDLRSKLKENDDSAREAEDIGITVNLFGVGSGRSHDDVPDGDDYDCYNVIENEDEHLLASASGLSSSPSRVRGRHILETV